MRRRLRGFGFFLEANDVVIGNFPAKISLQAALLKALLEENRAAGISHKSAGCGQ